MDEAHNITEGNKVFIKNNNCLATIGLTATPPRDKEKVKILKKIAPIVFTYGLDEGVKDGVVAPYDITVIYTDLNTKDKDILGGSKDKPFMTTEKATYDWMTKQIGRLMYAGPKMAKAVKFKILARMRFIYNLTNKTLIFCGSKAQAEKLCDNFYHSTSDEEAFNKFVDDKINRLSCVAKLNEGMNIENMDCAFVVQLNSNERDLVQRVGRIVRFRKNHIGKIFILVCRGTKDEDWAMKALESFGSVNIKHVDIKNYGYKV